MARTIHIAVYSLPRQKIAIEVLHGKVRVIRLTSRIEGIRRPWDRFLRKGVSNQKSDQVKSMLKALRIHIHQCVGYLCVGKVFPRAANLAGMSLLLPKAIPGGASLIPDQRPQKPCKKPKKKKASFEISRLAGYNNQCFTLREFGLFPMLLLLLLLLAFGFITMFESPVGKERHFPQSSRTVFCGCCVSRFSCSEV